MPQGHYDRTRIPRRGRPGHLPQILGDTDREWMNQAACARDDLTPKQVQAFADQFFPVSGRSNRDKRRYDRAVEEVQRICSSCPVSHRCDHYADALQEDNGIWAGIPEEVRDERRKRASLRGTRIENIG